MTKAKAKSITLDARSETRKGDAPKTDIQKMARELGCLWDTRMLLDEIETAARTKKACSPEHTSGVFGVMVTEANKLDDVASEKNDLLKAKILDTEPKDAIDALIIAIIFANEFQSGEDWTALALGAKTTVEGSAIVTRSDEEHRRHRDTIHKIIRGLCLGLNVSADGLGLRSFDCRGIEFDFDGAVDDLHRRAKKDGLPASAA